MKVNKNDFIACTDVDGTIIRIPNENDKPEDIIAITNPYTGKVKLRVVHEPNIDLMKQYKAQGYYIRVWSHSGSKWAKVVVEKLGLTDIVDDVEAKPIKMIDDLPIEQGIGRTLFVKED